MIRVVIADDHRLVIDGLMYMLDGIPEVQIVGTADSGESILRVLQDVVADIALLDINMPGTNGIEACKGIIEMHPNTRVIALTMVNESSVIRRMLEAGASGYLMKNTGRKELVECIKRVHAQGTYYSDTVAQTILTHVVKNSGQQPEHPLLSRREKQILKLITEQLTTQEIAQQLGIAFATVETHRRNIMQKLDVRNVAGMVKVAIERNLLDT